jgi:maltoporin
LQNNIAGVSIFERDGVTPKSFEGNATWYGFVNYLTYNWSDSLSTTARFEAFDDNKGYKTGFEGIYTTYTLGAVYKFTDGLWLRPEFRYDYNGTSAAYSGENGLFTAAADFIIRW